MFKVNNQNLNPPNEYIKSNFCYPMTYIKDINNNQINYLTHDEFNESYQNVIAFDQNFFNKIINGIKYAIDRFSLDYTHVQKIREEFCIPTLIRFSGLQHKGCNRWSNLLKYSKINNKNIKKKRAKMGNEDWYQF